MSQATKNALDQLQRLAQAVANFREYLESHVFSDSVLPDRILQPSVNRSGSHEGLLQLIQLAGVVLGGDSLSWVLRQPVARLQWAAEHDGLGLASDVQLVLDTISALIDQEVIILVLDELVESRRLAEVMKEEEARVLAELEEPGCTLAAGMCHWCDAPAVVLLRLQEGGELMLCVLHGAAAETVVESGAGVLCAVASLTRPGSFRMGRCHCGHRPGGLGSNAGALFMLIRCVP
jgi:hypothetical protein